MSTINQVLDGMMTIDGALGAAVVDYSSGMLLGSQAVSYTHLTLPTSDLV